MSEIKYVWKSIRVQETDYDGCYNCIHEHDSEDVCRVRGCVHAIGQIKDFYKRAMKTHDNTRETHSCVSEHTETHGDLISRKAEPKESHHRYEQGIIEGRVQVRTEMLKAIKDIVGDEAWNGI